MGFISQVFLNILLCVWMGFNYLLSGTVLPLDTENDSIVEWCGVDLVSLFFVFFVYANVRRIFER